MIIDTHAHLYSKEFDEDRDEMIARAIQAGVKKIFLPNIDLQSISSMNALRKWEGHIYPMLGLHPCSVDENYESILEIMYQELGKNIYYGIGETGIDLYWDKSTFEFQKNALTIQCAWAYEKNLPIILHTRNANLETIELLESLGNKKPQKGIFHCFSGSIEEISRIDALGDYYYGIGGVLTYKNSGLFEMIHLIPKHKIVLETDAPYLAPVPYRGKRNESAYSIYVLEKLAQALKLNSEEASALTTANANRLFFQ